MGTRSREVARLLKISSTTERRYRRAIDEAGLLAGEVDELPELEHLKAVVKAAVRKPRAPQAVSKVEPWREQIKQLWERGAGPKAIHDRLRLDDSDFKGSLWSVQRLVRGLARERGPKPEDVAIPIQSPPGEAQVDFGYIGKLYDPEQGVLRRAWLFALVLTNSRKMVLRIVFDQRLETWLRLHADAFEELGGVPTTIVPDNLKAAVVRAAFGIDGLSALNRSYRELARHYGFKVDPTPPRAPQKKGRVERSIRYVKHNFVKTLGDVDIHRARVELGRWNLEIADQRIHSTTGQKPTERFEEVDRPALLALPEQRYQTITWKTAKVHKDSHISFDKRLYSVPWRLIGKQVWVRATPESVEVSFDDTRVATHPRRGPSRSTVESHLPEGRRDLRHRSRAYWEERADSIGDEVGRYVRAVFDQDDVLSMLRRVQAIVTHLEKFPKARALAACRRAEFFGAYSYVALKNILTKGLDLQPLPVAVVEPAAPKSSYRFARNVRELLEQPLELTHEPH